jgi:hypothetical protein
MRRKLGVRSEKLPGRTSLEESPFLRRENADSGIYFQEITESRGVISVAVGNQNSWI